MTLSLAWRTVALLACAAALNYADRTSISSVFPLLKQDLGLTDKDLGAVGSYFLWAYAFASPFAGYLADRWPRGRLVAASLLAWSLVTLWTSFAGSLQELLASRILLGIAECAYLPAAVALIADHHPAPTRGRAMALHLMGLNAGLVGGGTLAGFLGETHGWRFGLQILAVAGVVLAGICALLLREGPERQVTAGRVAGAAPLGEQLRSVLSNVPYLFLAVQAALVSIGTWMFFNWMPLYFRETFGLSLGIAGFSGTATLQISAVMGALAGGFVSDRASQGDPARGRLRVMMLCYLLCAPCLLMFLVPNVGIASISAAVVLFSLLRAMATANETPAMCDLIPAANRSTGQALMNMANTIAGGIGVYVAGSFKEEFGLSAIFAGVSGVMLVATLFVFLASRQQRP
ncbi:MFS transporter [Bryobacterales bacterium F-183]|nr:MFS transporter [Bryobacterales bacterium F-183]